MIEKMDDVLSKWGPTLLKFEGNLSDSSFAFLERSSLQEVLVVELWWWDLW